MQKYLTTLFLGLFIGSSLAASPRSYYPHSTNTSWRYSSGETQVFAAAKIVNGLKVSVLQHIANKQVIAEDYLEYSADGVFLRGQKTGGKIIWYTPRLMIYPKAPLSVGMQWKSQSQSNQGGQITLKAEVLSQEGIVNSAGRYNALVIRTDISTSSNQSSSMQSYFVPSVGTVRYLSGNGDSIDLLRR